MLSLLAGVLLALAPQDPVVDTAFEQLHPASAKPVRSEECDRAVILINGFRPHPLSNDNADKAKVSGWQKAGSRICVGLAPKGDVYSFAYSQNVPIEKIAGAKGKDGRTLSNHIARLRNLGYKEIVLVAFSAGGLVARQLVEDHPGVGITKVIQVCPPNAGTSWGKLDSTVREKQEPFVRSLSREGREAFLKDRNKRIPDHIEFVTVVGTGAGSGDLVVHVEAQWPKDLQDQGIPVHAVKVVHSWAMWSPTVRDKIAELIDARQDRWSGERVKKAREELLD